MISVNIQTGEVTNIPDNVPMLDNNAFLAGEARSRRNALLKDCDWTQTADAPLTNAARIAWKTYRQALRDVTTQPGFPAAVSWPIKPTA